MERVQENLNALHIARKIDVSEDKIRAFLESIREHKVEEVEIRDVILFKEK